MEISDLVRSSIKKCSKFTHKRSLVLGLLWSSFRVLNLGSLSSRLGGNQRDSKPEDDLLKWIASMTEGYGVEVNSFKTRSDDCQS